MNEFNKEDNKEFFEGEESVFGYLISKLSLSTVFFREYNKNQNDGLRCIREKLKRKRRYRTIRYVLSAASVILLFISGTFLLMKHNPARERGGVMVCNNEFGQVYLKLDGVESINLNEKFGVLYRDENKEVLVQDGSLIYVPNEDGVIVDEYYTLSVSRGAEYYTRLEDGTEVWLNSGSEFRYPVSFSGDVRIVEVVGEAFFNVTHDSLRPFIVKSGGVESTVLGTSFGVKNYPEQSLILVTLATGKLEVATDDDRYVIDSGFQVTFNKETNSSSVGEVDVERYISWKNGYYYFNMTPLEEIMHTLCLWNDINVEYEDESVKNIRFSGQLKKYDEISGLFEHFEYTNNTIMFREEDRTVIISRK